MAKPSQPRASAGRQGGQALERSAPSLGRVAQSTPGQAPAADSDAVGLFERGMSSLQRHKYGEALARFEDLLERFPDEGPLADRARVYAARCHRQLTPPADDIARPADERLAAATAALNDGDDERAARLAGSVLADAPEHDHAHYLLAVVHARRGAVPAALDALRRAIATSPEVRVQARHDPDFEVLQDTEAFGLLIAEPPAHSDTPNNS